jgi:hypothetical protein
MISCGGKRGAFQAEKKKGSAYEENGKLMKIGGI